MDDNTVNPWNLHFCKVCRYGSKSKFVIRKHIRLHQKRPKSDIMCDSKTPELFECELCEFSTDLKVKLTEHLRILHQGKEAVEDQEDIFKCHRCEKCGFKTHSLLVLTNHLDNDCKNKLTKNDCRPNKTDLDDLPLSKRKFKKLETTDESECEATGEKRQRVASADKAGSSILKTCGLRGYSQVADTQDLQNSNKTLTAIPCCCNASMLLSMYPEITSNATTSGFYGKVISMLLEIKEQNSQILDYLKRERLNPSVLATPVTYEDFPVDLPLASQKDLDELEFFLKDKKNLAEFTLYLSSLGGVSVVSRTNMILKRVITNELASEYNFCGKRSQKKPFNALSLKVAIVQALQRGLPNVTEREVEDAIKSWLKHAPQRMKNENR